MAEEETEEEVAEGDGEAEAPKGGRKKLILIALAAVILFGGGGAGAYFFLLSPGAEATEMAEEDTKPPLSDDAVFVEIERLSVPLIGEDRRILGYVHLDFNLEVHSADGEEMLRREMPLVKHAINVAMSKRGAGETENPRIIDYEGTAERLKEAANAALSEPAVEAVHIISATPL